MMMMMQLLVRYISFRILFDVVCAPVVVQWDYPRGLRLERSVFSYRKEALFRL